MKKTPAILFVMMFLTTTSLCFAEATKMAAKPAEKSSPATVKKAEMKKDAKKAELADRDILFQVPFKVDINKPFIMKVSLKPAATKKNILLDDTDGSIEYNPSQFDVRPGEKKIVKAVVKRTSSGLVNIYAHVDGDPYHNFTIDAGFSAHLQARNLDLPVESGCITSTNFDFVDLNGKPVSIEAPVRIILQSSNVTFRLKDSDQFKEEIALDIIDGERSTPSVQILAKPWKKDTGIITATIMINPNVKQNQLVILNQSMKFTILPSWWLTLIMAVIGGMLYSTYNIFNEINKLDGAVIQKKLQRILYGAFIGALAYFFVDWDIIGIKVDTTSLKGFVILGFLFSYVGADLFLKKIAPKTNSGSTFEKANNEKR